MFYANDSNLGGQGVRNQLDLLGSSISSESGGIWNREGKLLDNAEVVEGEAVATPARQLADGSHLGT